MADPTVRTATGWDEGLLDRAAGVDAGRNDLTS